MILVIFLKFSLHSLRLFVNISMLRVLIDSIYTEEVQSWQSVQFVIRAYISEIM